MSSNSLETTTSNITLSGVSKRYRLFDNHYDRLRYLLGLRRGSKEEVWALKQISLEFKKGETVGIVGRNGSGKSTLLQLICGIISPTHGSIQTAGRIAPLLELGTGFKPEFSGHDNIFINAALLGLSKKEIQCKYNSIIAFAEIGDYIHRPLKTYSSGMLVRLGFAVATSIDPNILVIDEALAVGDESFQRKCYGRIRELQECGTTIIFVSHSNQNIIQFCTRAVLIDHGELIAVGKPKLIINCYQKINFSGKDDNNLIRNRLRDIVNSPYSETEQEILTKECLDGSGSETTPSEPTGLEPRNKVLGSAGKDWYDPNLETIEKVCFETHAASISELAALNTDHEVVNNLSKGLDYTFTFTANFKQEVQGVIYTLAIRTSTGYVFTGRKSANHHYGIDVEAVQIGDKLKITWPFKCFLNPGTYYLNAVINGLVNGDETTLARIVDGYIFNVIEDSDYMSIGVANLLDAPKITLINER